MNNNFDFDDNDDDWKKHHDNRLDLYELIIAFIGTFSLVYLIMKIIN